MLKSWNNLSFVNISPTLVIDSSMERSSRVLQHGNPKIWIFFKEVRNSNFDFRQRAEIILASSISALHWYINGKRSSRVLQHGNIKIWFKKIRNWIWLVFYFKFEIEFWLVPKRWNHSSRSQHAPIWRHRGCIVVPSRVDI